MTGDRWRRGAGALTVAAATIAATIAAPAQAAWVQATSPHFVIYSEGRADGVRELAEDLERLDGFARIFHGKDDGVAATSNKLTVFVTAGVDAVQTLCGKCPNVYGFYVPRASGSIAFTPRRSGEGGATDLGPRTVLFHEYAHHFMLGNYAQAYPAWFSEGYAELMSTLRSDGKVVMLGNAPMHRAYALMVDAPLPARRLFDPGAKKGLSEDQVIQLYARGWLLTHYIMFDVGRREQMTTYLKLLNAGTPSVEAATKAFGDLGALDKALNRYRDRPRLPGVSVPFDKIPTPAITVRALTAGEQAMMPWRMRSVRGVNRTTAGPVHAGAAPIAAAYPGDATVQGWFAEIAYDAGRDAEAEAAADRALTVDAKLAQALLYKANVALRRATAAKDAGAIAEARQIVVRANRLDPNVAEPLVTYYRSFPMVRETPSKSAIAALYRAQELVPQDPDVRMLAVRQSLLDNDVPGAIQLLRPLAYSPHGGADNPAARLLTLLEAGKGRDAALADGATAVEQP